MSTEKKPKWEIGMTILKGKQASSLFEKYSEKLLSRIQADQFEQFRSNLSELEVRHAGQEEQLVSLKSKTKGQDESISDLRQTVSSIRKIVNSASPAPEIAEAFGIGFSMSRSVNSVIAASNMIVTAYNENTAWSNQAGLIEADMEEIAALQGRLTSADNVQEGSKVVRKTATMDKNTIQRAVEDEITRLSAIGVLVFGKADPAIAKLFEDLIPN